MLIFLGVCFLIVTLHMTELKFNAAAPKYLTALYVAGVILLDISILVMMCALWWIEHGKV